MKLRLKQEEFLDNTEAYCMKRFKQGSIIEDAEMIHGTFFGTEIPKKIFKAGPFRFEEWEPGVFEKVFEVL